MSKPRTAIFSPRVLLVLALAVVAALLVVVWIWRSGVDLAQLKSSWVYAETWLKANPWAMFLALAFLPGLPVPMMLLLPLAGFAWEASTHPVKAGLLMLAAMAINLTWTYWVAARPARFLVEKLLASTSIQLPLLPKGEHIRLILILRLTPGIPFFIQNYLLGFLRAPFYAYLPISLVLSGMIAFGIMLFPDAMQSGNTKQVITGLSLIIVGILVTMTIRTRFTKRTSDAAADPAADI